MQLEPLSATALKSRLERHGKTFVYTNVRGKVALVPKLPSTEACDTILESLEAQEILDPISNIFRNPIIIKNGDSVKVLGSGWHPDNGGVFVAGQTAIPDVPFAEAKDRLMSLMDDFLFVQESDKTRMLSAIISPALRFGGFIGGNCPLHAFEATESQTGKGYACEIIEAVYNEPPSIVAIKNGGVGSFDESLSERLSQGRPLIRFDNLRGKLDSQFLEMVITAPGAVGLRIPHRGEIHADVKHFFFLATSNGLESTEDLANRCCIIRLRKQAQGYKFKTFADGRDLISHVKKNSALYLGSIFSIVKEWAFAKFPEESRYHHDFREWHGKVEGLIKLAWPSTAPLMAQHMEALLRTSNPALSWARKLCSVIDRQGQLDKILYASAIAELCQEDDIEIPGLRVGADSYAAKKQVGLLLAKVHRLGETVALDEYQITKSEEKKPRDDGKGFYAQKTYTFAKQGQNHPLPENEAKPEILSKSPVSPSKSTKDSGNSSFSMKDVTPYWETPRLTGEPSKPVISGVPQELLTAGNDRRPRQDLF